MSESTDNSSTAKRESPNTSSVETPTKVTKKLKVARRKLTDSLRSSTLREKYRRYRNPGREKRFHQSEKLDKFSSGSQEDLSFSIASLMRDNDEDKLHESYKDVKVGLMYFEAIAMKRRMEQISGSATRILEDVINILDQLSRSQYAPEFSSVLSSCRNQVIESLARLVRWADSMLLMTDDNVQDEPFERIPEIIKSLQKSIDELVHQALNNVQLHKSAPVSPISPTRAISLPDVFGSLRITRTVPYRRAPLMTLHTSRQFSDGLVVESGATHTSKLPLWDIFTPPTLSEAHGIGDKCVGDLSKASSSQSDNLLKTKDSLVFRVKGLTNSEEVLFARKDVHPTLHQHDQTTTSVDDGAIVDEREMSEVDNSIKHHNKIEQGDLGKHSKLPQDVVEDYTKSYNFVPHISDVKQPLSSPNELEQSLLGNSELDLKSLKQIDEEELSLLPIKKNKIDIYMQLFAQNHPQPPPLSDIYRETARRYHVTDNTPSSLSGSPQVFQPQVDSLHVIPDASGLEKKNPDDDPTSSSQPSSIHSSKYVYEGDRSVFSPQDSSTSSSSGSLTSFPDRSEVSPLPLQDPNLPRFFMQYKLDNSSSASSKKLSLHNQPIATTSPPAVSSEREKHATQGTAFRFPPVDSYHITENKHNNDYKRLSSILPKRSSKSFRRTSILNRHINQTIKLNSQERAGNKDKPVDDSLCFNDNTSGYRKQGDEQNHHPSHHDIQPILHESMASVQLSTQQGKTEAFTSQEGVPAPIPAFLEKPSCLKIEKENEKLPKLHRHRCYSQGGCELPPSDPGNLLDELDSADYLTFHSHSNQRAPEICGGCHDALIVYATEANKKNLIYYEAFLTTYRTFISPMDLLKKLTYRLKKFGVESTTVSEGIRNRICRNAFFLLIRVVDELSLMDINDSILVVLVDLVHQLLCRGDMMLAKLLRSKFLMKHEHRKINYLDRLKQPLAKLQITAKAMNIQDFGSEKIAEQMTLLDLELFQKIEIPEVLQWAQKQSENLSPNLTRFTEHFNNISYWARTIILSQSKLLERERLLNKFVRIMRHLRKLNNFNSYLAVLSALDSAPVRRLEWQRHTTENLKEYCSLIDSSSSFKAYREALAEASQPCIPYLGLILQDLTFIHLGNEDELAPGVVNFRKRWQQFNILDTMRRFKQSHYPFQRDEVVIRFMGDFSNFLSEEALWDLSLELKPRQQRPKRLQSQGDDQLTVSSVDSSTEDHDISHLNPGDHTNEG